MKTGHWYLVGIGVFGLFVAVLVAIGLAWHQEPGLMEDAPRWNAEEMPLELCAFSYAYRDADGFPGVRHDDLEKISYVVGLINERLGFQAYTLSGGDDCSVLLTLGVPTEPGWQDPGGSAAFSGGQCDAVTANVFGEVQTLTIYHELGHCLGLADDQESFQQSIMRPVQTETEYGQFRPWFSDTDRQTLRELYAPQ